MSVNKMDDLGFKLNIWKYKTRNIIKKYNLLNEDYFLFYTSINNLEYILENGIDLVSEIKLKQNEKYVVWTYSQLRDQTNLELVNSNHNNFWIWLSNQNINKVDVVTIGIDIRTLFKKTKKNWKYNNETLSVSIFEKINTLSFKWIMFKNRSKRNEISDMINKSKLSIKLFYSLDGNVKA